MAQQSSRHQEYISIKGASQNNLKNLDIDLPLGKLIVVTGVSGSGKSSFAFDTVYSEGQRRYFETFSPYTRQFLDRMDKPRVESIEGIPPAIAIDQTNPVRTSRSTVGTMTELNDHLKLLFARAANLYCSGCGKEVRRDSPDTVFTGLEQSSRIKENGKIIITFPVTIPHNFSEEEVVDLLGKQGYHHIYKKVGRALEVIQDRTRFSAENRTRIIEDIEAAFHYGGGKCAVYPVAEQNRQGAKEKEKPTPLRFSRDLHCADCDIHYRDPIPNMFSFNSPVGACETCRGFGRTIGIDYDLVIPDKTKSLAEGAVKPWQTESYEICRQEMMHFARKSGIRTNVPWEDLSPEEKRWVIEGEGEWDEEVWYGAKRFFEWLETKSYKMHIRVLLSKYRTYHLCPDCKGARLKPESLLWRIGGGSGREGREVRAGRRGDSQGRQGLSIHDIMQLPLSATKQFFAELKLPAPLDEATEIVLREINSRLDFLVEVGLGYLTLDRQSRTLSGGEVQRINLTTALGTSLVNTLFVLDEPSIGLHSRDIKRLISILHKLRDTGNTLLVVEHDPEVIRAADMVLDLGPAAGEQGGEIVFFGPAEDLLHHQTSLTGAYLSGRKRTGEAAATAGGTDRGDAVIAAEEAGTGSFSPSLTVLGAAEHNLKEIDVSIPLGRLVCITGVSGSGKSTLIDDILYKALRMIKHKPLEQPGTYRDIRGHEAVDDVVLVDQSPIGKTTRSNPVSFVGALDPIRKLFSKTPEAIARGYTAGAFSFNSVKGRCPVCSGSGYEHVEMQFLSDVYIRCPECGGKRYRPDVLEITIELPGGPKSIADVLDMTVDDAVRFFKEEPKIAALLRPLLDVGLGYIRLGQPVPTLSGGEAQRLKLAGHLASTASYGRGPSGKQARGKKNQHILFLFDEPTTGLHFSDIDVLLGAFRSLTAAGHSLVVIEHNLDVIGAADWIIDLGPEGGEAGGEVTAEGTPEDIRSSKESYTGAALRTIKQGEFSGSYFLKENPLAPKPMLPPTNGNHSIMIRGAKEHNLKDVDITIPRETFTVITGVSGSGKSTVAFDILFSEGQRRYLESLNAYARQFVQPVSRPEVDGVTGVPPTVAIEQRTSRGGWKSTVATVTELFHFLRLLFLRLGTQYCPECDVPIEPQTPEAIRTKVLSGSKNKSITILSPLVVARKGYYTDLAKWAAKKGHETLRVDGRYIRTDSWPRLDRYREHTIELPIGDIKVSPRKSEQLQALIDAGLSAGSGIIHVLEDGSVTVYSTKRACPSCGRSFPELDPRLFSFNSKHGWCPACTGTGVAGLTAEEDDAAGGRRTSGENGNGNVPGGADREVCPVCNGARLNSVARSVRYRDKPIEDFNRMTAAGLHHYFENIKLKGREAEIARDITAELTSRLTFIEQVGLGYLTLDRAAPTLSGGEAQRIRLASQLGSNLRGVCYILDEPTIGLHPRDNRMLLDTLHHLKRKGNSVVVVEHDETTIKNADHIIDLGPGGGVRGGELIFAGPAGELLENRSSETARFLRSPLSHPLISRKEKAQKEEPEVITVKGAREHNLKEVDVTIPLGSLITITGVSGSGKSTLARDILYRNLKQVLKQSAGKRQKPPRKNDFHGCSSIEGWETISRVLEVDQTPIGKTPRSCPATYVGFWDDVRKLFAGLPEARMRGYTPSRFSFNVTGGRCEACGGQGVKKIEMSFLPDVKVLCEVCGGKRFNRETLDITYRGKSIADVLAMSFEEAEQFFEAHTSIHHAVQLVNAVGLGYLTLGQQSPTLSGGEAQRIKLVTELAKAKPDTAGGRTRRGTSNKNHTLYILDEPTVGLHTADVERLLRVLYRLVESGNTIVIIEHNLDVIAEADWIIDLGPEGGDDGGFVVAEGPPRQLSKSPKGSYTLEFLKDFFKERT